MTDKEIIRMSREVWGEQAILPFNELKLFAALVRAEYEAPLKLAEEALNAMLTHMGMDEDEWTKPTFNQAREAIAAIHEALAEQSLQNLSDFHQHMEATEPKCSEHPDAPHGFDRNASHSTGRYVCECEGWEPVKQEPVAVISESAIGLVKLHANGVSLPFGTQLYAAPVSVKAAVLAEREACAKVCEDMANNPMTGVLYSWKCAAAIRARSEK